MRRLGAGCLALALRASLMFAERELRPIAGLATPATQPVLERAALPTEGAVVVQFKPRLAAPRLASHATASLKLRAAA